MVAKQWRIQDLTWRTTWGGGSKQGRFLANLYARKKELGPVGRRERMLTAPPGSINARVCQKERDTTQMMHRQKDGNMHYFIPSTTMNAKTSFRYTNKKYTNLQKNICGQFSK